MDVSVIIVNYNNKQLILACLESIETFTSGLEYEVIVSDNGSTDESVDAIREKYPWVTTIENGANLGFGAANNRAAAFAKGKYILYLNSDTLLKNNAIKLFFDYFENAPDRDSLGGIGCNLVDGDGNPAFSAGTFSTYLELCHFQWGSVVLDFKRSVRKILGIKHPFLNKKKSSAADNIDENLLNISGADLFLRNDEYALFDERYFLYFEEVDLELRLHRMGKRFKLVDGPQIVHLERGSQSPDAFSRIVPNCWIDYSSVLYSKKNLGTRAVLLKLLIFIRFINPLAIRRTKPFIWKVLTA